MFPLEAQEPPVASYPAPEINSGEREAVELAPLLDDEELANLDARAEQPPDNLAGGALSNEHLTYIVIALAAAIIVLIAK
ncbi:MAG: hypothetical protein GY953_44625 [bacterium]|nr:hypothetical protein [bacterium]